jgi:predicted ATPase
MLDLLSLSNFKSIKEEDFELVNLTLFSGLNGMGKSSALQSLLLLRQSYEKHTLPNTGLSLSGDYVHLGNGKDLLFNNAEQEFIKIEACWTDSTLNYIFDYIENSDMQPINSEQSEIDGNPFEEALFVSKFQYLSAERISPKSVYDVSEYAVNQRRSLGTKGEYTAHFLSQHGDKNITIHSLQHKSAPTSYLIDNLNAWMSDITPGTKVITKLIPEINQASLHYQFSSATELTEKFRPENTGFGLTYVLPVVTAILSARPGDLLIIENPESHLHPSGQALVAKMIAIAAESGVQIIIETHSDHFLNGIRTSVKSKDIESENVLVYFLYRNQDQDEHCALVDKLEIDSKGRIDHWPEGFFDEWDKSLSTLLKDD